MLPYANAFNICVLHMVKKHIIRHALNYNLSAMYFATLSSLSYTNVAAIRKRQLYLNVIQNDIGLFNQVYPW